MEDLINFEDRVQEPPLELGYIPNEIKDRIFHFLDKKSLPVFMLDHRTASSAQLGLWEHLICKPGPPPIVTLAETRQFVEHFDAYLEDFLKFRNSMGDSSPIRQRFGRSTKDLTRFLALVIPNKLVYVRYDENYRDTTYVETLEHYRPKDIEIALHEMSKLRQLTLLGADVKCMEAFETLSPLLEEPDVPLREPVLHLTLPNNPFDTIQLPSSVKNLIVRDEHASTPHYFEKGDQSGLDEGSEDRPKPLPKPWLWKGFDTENTDVLRNFTGFEKVQTVRYVEDQEWVHNHLSMMRFLPQFKSLKRLRLGGMRPEPDFTRLFLPGIAPEVYQESKRVIERLSEALPKSCLLLDIRPTYVFKPIHIFVDNWPEKLHWLRTVRLPLRNALEAFPGTKPNHAIHIEVIVTRAELVDHHKNLVGNSWVCASLKVLEELNMYFSRRSDEWRRVSFVGEDVYAEDDVWNPTLNMKDWDVHAFAAVDSFQKWLATLNGYAFQKLALQYKDDARAFYDFIEVHVAARGNLGARCTLEAKYEDLYDSDETESSFGLYTEDEGGDAGDDDIATSEHEDDV